MTSLQGPVSSTLYHLKFWCFIVRGAEIIQCSTEGLFTIKKGYRAKHS